jgi:hypothetical protein
MKILKTSTLAVAFWGLSMGAVAGPDKPRVFQAAPVVNANTAVEVGAAWLRRSKNRVDGRIMTTVDYAGIPYTVWWIIFNNPAGCIADCGMIDVTTGGGAAADVAIFNASGAISAMDGMGYGGVINLDLAVIGGEGARIGSQEPPPPATMAPPWNRVLKKNNARCAEIHLDINFHANTPELGEEGYWVRELTYPAPLPPPTGTEAFAAFKPPADCKKKSRK